MKRKKKNKEETTCIVPLKNGLQGLSGAFKG